MPRKPPETPASFYEVTDAWREDVDRELRRRRLTRQALAKALGVHKSSVTVLMRRTTSAKPGPRTSKMAKPVADFLGVPLPSQIADETERAIPHLRAIRQRNQKEYDRIIALLEEMSGLALVKEPTGKK